MVDGAKTMTPEEVARKWESLGHADRQLLSILVSLRAEGIPFPEQTAEDISRDTWATRPGNGMNISYYAANVVGNPTAQTNLPSVVEYQTDAVTVYTVTVTYNSEGEVITTLTA